MMTRAELEQWLGDLDDESVGVGELSDVLHLVLEASRRSLSLANAGELRELRFALAVLRDVFPNDAGIRAWLRAPAPEGHGFAPADLVSAGRIHDFGDLAVWEWNRPHGCYDESESRHSGPSQTPLLSFVIHGTYLA